MDLGLGNFKELKAFLLASSMQTPGNLDSAIAAIGSGIARHFANYCDRKFARVAGDTCECDGERYYYVVPRYPIEAVTLIETRYGLAESYVAQPLTDFLLEQRNSAGLLGFTALQGVRGSMIRITYTGGYWYDTTEDNTGVQPVGSERVPDDLKLAWLLWCQEVFNKRDKLGISVSTAPGEQVVIPPLEMPPAIREKIKPYRRFQLS
ncbi:MAG TPA: hypothetical protein VMF06_23205 [Candidatus Limnocylindria bacterium]|jgi:hypothetical protein|nr:hypothetical protein [Candidatus Limnocylindria bacterium]